MDDLMPVGKFFAVGIDYLCIVGLWSRKEYNRKETIAYKAYSLTVYALGFAYMVITGIGLYKIGFENKREFMNNLDKSFVGYTLFIRVISYQVNHSHVQDLIDHIIASGDKVPAKCLKNIKNILIGLSGLIFFSVGTFSLICNMDGEMTVVAWMPFDPYKNRMNLLTSTQIIGLTFLPSAFRGVASQGIFYALLIYICEQLKDLQCRFRTLDYETDGEMLFREKFKDIVKKHVRLIRYTKRMNSIFHAYLFCHYLGVSIEMCLNILMISLVGSDEKKLLVSFIAFLSLTLFMTYLYCYFGSQLQTMSSQLTQAAYESTWISWPVNMQKDLLLFIAVSQKTLTISAGGLVTICMNTYSRTLYNGYSVAALLRDMVD